MKKWRRTEKKMKRKKETIEEVCNEILKEGEPKWKKRRVEEIKRKKEEDKMEAKEFERSKRKYKAERKKVEFVKKLEKTGKKKKQSSEQSWRELKKKMWRNIRKNEEEEKEYETENEAEIDIIEEANLILETLEELEEEASVEKIEAEKAILGEENQSKNLQIVQIPDGTEEANDTPVFVEVEVMSEERVLEWENQAKNPEIGEKEVVKIPNGSISSSLSSNNIPDQDSPIKTCPGIYKKGACPPKTELPPVMLPTVIIPSEKDGSASSPNSNRKRKREVQKEEKKGEKEGFRVKYVGETNRSAYERGKEHMRQFRNLEEGRHLLKHYLQYHRNIRMEEIEFGMKVRASFKSAIERQISEAVAISLEEKSGTQLMNSKAEYNRCKLPRLNTQSIEDQIKEVEEGRKKSKEISAEIRDLRKKKKSRKNKEMEEDKEKEGKKKNTRRSMQRNIERR